MSAHTYNLRQLVGPLSDAEIADMLKKWERDAGMSLTPEMITELVEYWQRGHGLTVDGFCGPNTQGTIAAASSSSQRFYPLRCLPDGRRPIITSAFYTENPSRSSHKGVDFFFRWLDSDPDVPVGDGGAIRRNGKRKWWYPPGTCAVAAAFGVVMKAGRHSTGFRAWIDHGDGTRTGYFHLKDLRVTQGHTISAGADVGLVGDNPNGHDGKHLHFETSPVGSYAPTNPRKWLKNAKYLEA